MTSTARLLVPVPVRLDFDALAPVFARAMSELDDAATKQLDDAAVPLALRELVRLRASQINGCAYCVDMHATAGRTQGASAQTVDAVAIWHDSGLFTSAERAALALTEEITRMGDTHVRGEVLDAAVAEHGEEATAALIALVVTINAWNAIGVSTRCWTVQPRSAA
jgi:AhpD family alkylhydroperoxidase